MKITNQWGWRSLVAAAVVLAAAWASPCWRRRQWKA
jgi:hypothetical protein